MKEVVDAFTALTDGMNSGIAPGLIKDTSYARGINITSRGGLVRTRPGFTRMKALPFSGAYQGASRWRLNSTDRMVAVAGGHLYSMRTDTLDVIDHGLKFNALAQCYFCQADRFMLIRDGSSPIVVLEEDTEGVAQIRPGSMTPLQPDIPSGTVMAFVHGRVHGVPQYLPTTTENGRPYFLSSDIALPNDPGACLIMTETDYLNEGGAHGLPMEMGYINGMSVFRNAPTGTGYGPLIVLAQYGVAAFDVSVPRADWKNQQIGQILFYDVGTESPWSPTQVNDDLLYRSADGLRILKYTSSAVAAGSGMLSNTAQSTEVSVYMDPESSAALPYVSTVFVDNYALATVGASAAEPRAFQGLVCLDTAYVAAFHTAVPPMYNGLWQIEGAKINQVLSLRKAGKTLLTVITDDNYLWSLDVAAVTDNGIPIRSRLITKEMNFKNLRSLKSLQDVTMWISEIATDCLINVYYRPAGYPFWSLFGTQTVSVPAGGSLQRRRALHMGLDKSVTACDPTSGDSLWNAQSFQFAIEVMGSLRIDGFLVTANEISDTVGDPCSESTGVPLVPSASAGVVLEDYL